MIYRLIAALSIFLTSAVQADDGPAGGEVSLARLVDANCSFTVVDGQPIHVSCECRGSSDLDRIAAFGRTVVTLSISSELLREVGADLVVDRFPNLTTLAVLPCMSPACQVVPDDYDVLLGHPKLTSLSIGPVVQRGRPSTRSTSSESALRQLTLNHVRPDIAAELISGLNLTSLTVRGFGSEWPRELVESAAKMARLESLTLTTSLNAQQTPLDLTPLARHESITYLHLQNAYFDRVQLAELRTLKHLWLCHCRTTDTGSSVFDLAGLRTLVLEVQPLELLGVRSPPANRPRTLSKVDLRLPRLPDLKLLSEWRSDLAIELGTRIPEQQVRSGADFLQEHLLRQFDQETAAILARLPSVISLAVRERNRHESVGVSEAALVELCRSSGLQSLHVSGGFDRDINPDSASPVLTSLKSIHLRSWPPHSNELIHRLDNDLRSLSFDFPTGRRSRALPLAVRRSRVRELAVRFFGYNSDARKWLDQLMTEELRVVVFEDCSFADGEIQRIAGQAPSLREVTFNDCRFRNPSDIVACPEKLVRGYEGTGWLI